MSVVVLGNEIARTPQTSLAGIGVIAAGIPVYWWMRRKAPVALRNVPARD
jgi:hypothetical protein